MPSGSIVYSFDVAYGLACLISSQVFGDSDKI